MATQNIRIPFKRGTTSQNDDYLGDPGEITVDSTKRNLRVHDGIKRGGEELLRRSDLGELQTLVDQLTPLVAEALTAAGDLTAAVAAAAASASSASTDAASANTDATSAHTDAVAAAASAAAAAASKVDAAASQVDAAASKLAAAASATAAAASQADALTSKLAAAAAAAAASASETAAAASELAAAVSAAAAAVSETNAAASATSALSSKNAASTSETNAAASAASLAAALASFRQRWLGSFAADPTLDGNGNALAEGAEYFNTVTNKIRVYVEGAWEDADASAQTATSNAITSAAAAAASASAAASSATAAATSGTNAAASATAAGTSETNAAASAAAALVSKNAAAASATAAGTSETNAAASATASASSATAAGTSETNAAASATASANSATDSANSAATSEYWANQATAGQLQADWTVTDSANLAYIKHKPDLALYALLTDNISGTAANVTGIVAIANGGTGATDAATARGNLGLGNVENKSSATIRGEITSGNVITALGFTPVNAAIVGANSGIAQLDSGGKVPAAQLPSYVDDVLEYAATANFPVSGETGKIYIAVNSATSADPSRAYRWSGTVYTEIEPSPGSTDAVAEGSTNLYFTAARVRAVVLTGLDLTVNAAIAATDSVLGAFGKLQKQITDLIATVATKAPLADPAFTGNPTAATQAAGDSSTRLATTAFVGTAVTAASGYNPITKVTAVSTTYTSGRITQIVETINGGTSTTNITYNTDGTVNTITTVYNSITRTETYAYSSGVFTGMTATEV